MGIKLRPYQEDIVRRVLADWDTGYTDVLVTAATGAGKTIVALEILDRAIGDSHRRALILSHRDELVQQPVDRLCQFWPHRAGQAGIVKAQQDDVQAQIISASVQTLVNPQRLQGILDHGPIAFLWIDECHHSTAPTYMRVYEALRAANPDLKHLGVTATPLRSDGIGLHNVYQKESARYGIKELVNLGWLCPPRWLAIQTGISLKGVRSNRRADGDYDFSPRRLANVFETDNCFELVAESHKRFAGDRLALAFTPSVEGAHRLAEKFNAADIPAAAADGGTDHQQRGQILRDLRNGKIRVAVNCQLWTEGVDIPEISCIHMVRPTRSDSLYVQCVGRGLRIVPGKEDCLILDYCPVDTRNVVMLGDVLAGQEIRREVYMKPESVPGEVAGGFTFDQSGLRTLEGDPAELISRRLDYLSASPWRWIRHPSGWMFISLGPGSTDRVDRTLAMSPIRDTMSLFLLYRRPGEVWKVHQFREGTFEELSEAAEAYLEYRGNLPLIKRNLAWQHEPATEPQRRYAISLGCWEPGMSRGDCANAITATLALKVLRERGYLDACDRARESVSIAV